MATWLHVDHLGSVRAITDATGAKVESAIYRPFGEHSEWLLPGNASPETKGWIGERYDADAGLQYLNARYYDPALGLFLQPDWFEVTKPGMGTNRFSYSFNDPVNKIDPGGNQINDETTGDEFDGPSCEESGGCDYRMQNWASRIGRNLRAARDNPLEALSGMLRGAVQDVAGLLDAVPRLPSNTRTGLLSVDMFGAAQAFVDACKGSSGCNDYAFGEMTPAEQGGYLIGSVATGAAGLARAGIKGLAKTVDNVVCSFDGATLVLAMDGSRPIRDILPGKDLVWGLDADGVGDWHIVEGKTVATYNHKIALVLRDEETGVTQTITSNRIHPYFAQVPEGEVVPPASEGFAYDGPLARGHWIDAGNLKSGFRLLNPDGTWAEVVSVTETPATLDAWNLTVEGAHSYFVAETVEDQPVWVHNGPCQLPTNKIARAEAAKNGWVETSYFSKGKPVFKDPKTGMHYTVDQTNHSGNGMWKGATSPKELLSRFTRSGTYDKFLNWIGK